MFMKIPMLLNEMFTAMRKYSKEGCTNEQLFRVMDRIIPEMYKEGIVFIIPNKNSQPSKALSKAYLRFLGITDLDEKGASRN